MEFQLSLTAEHAVALSKLAGIGLKTVFEHVGHGVSVAKVFLTFKAEAGTGVVAVDHFKLGHSRSMVQINVGETKTCVDDTVERDLCSACGGSRHGGCNSDGDLFHLLPPCVR